MADVQFKMEGIDDVFTVLKELPKRTQNKVIPQALRKAAKPIAKAANTNVPKDISIRFAPDKQGGQKFKSSDIKVKTFIRGKAGNKYALIGAEVNNDMFFNFPTFIEFGTLAHRTTPLKKGRSDAAQRAADAGLGLIKQPFMRPALSQQGGNALKILRVEILSGITKQTENIFKRGKV